MQDNYYQASKENWQEIAATCLQNTIDVGTPAGDVKIKLLLGTDAVHGNQHVLGSSTFRHILQRGNPLPTQYRACRLSQPRQFRQLRQVEQNQRPGLGLQFRLCTDSRSLPQLPMGKVSTAI